MGTALGYCEFRWRVVCQHLGVSHISCKMQVMLVHSKQYELPFFKLAKVYINVMRVLTSKVYPDCAESVPRGGVEQHQ